MINTTAVQVVPTIAMKTYGTSTGVGIAVVVGVATVVGSTDTAVNNVPLNVN